MIIPMEAQDLKLIEQHRKANYQLDKLWKDHQALETKINKMEAAKGLSADEEKELHTLKKKKLDGRDQLEKMLAPLR